MPDPEVITGETNEKVNPDAGDSDDLGSLLFGDDVETGDDGDADQDIFADLDDEQQDTGDTGDTDPEHIAFSKKWEAKKDEVKQQAREEIMSEMRQQQQQQQHQGLPQQLSDDQAQKLADEYGMTEKAVRGFYELQQELNAQKLREHRRDIVDRERSDYTGAKTFVQEATMKNKKLPGWDEKALIKYRREHYSQTGQILPWKQAYRGIVADAVMSGDITRKTQQETIKQIQKRDAESVGLKQPSTQPLDIRNLSKEDFEKIAEKAKTGAYKKS